jgi:hypothetical protein
MNNVAVHCAAYKHTVCRYLQRLGSKGVTLTSCHEDFTMQKKENGPRSTPRTANGENAQGREWGNAWESDKSRTTLLDAIQRVCRRTNLKICNYASRMFLN